VHMIKLTETREITLRAPGAGPRILPLAPESLFDIRILSFVDLVYGPTITLRALASNSFAILVSLGRSAGANGRIGVGTGRVRPLAHSK
jgi:hypothetical protein